MHPLNYPRNQWYASTYRYLELKFPTVTLSWNKTLNSYQVSNCFLQKTDFLLIAYPRYLQRRHKYWIFSNWGYAADSFPPLPPSSSQKWPSLHKICGMWCSKHCLSGTLCCNKRSFMVTGGKPTDKSPPVKSYVSLGFRPGAFHRGANVRGLFTRTHSVFCNLYDTVFMRM